MYTISLCVPTEDTQYTHYTQPNTVHGHKGRTMYVCLDKYPETVDGEQRDTNGALMYHVEVQCNRGLPCPPYDDRKELSCVVCTK